MTVVHEERLSGKCAAMFPMVLFLKTTWKHKLEKKSYIGMFRPPPTPPTSSSSSSPSSALKSSSTLPAHRERGFLTWCVRVCAGGSI